MGRFHRPGDEKRSLVVVPPAAWNDWLCATTKQAVEMLVDMPDAEFEAATHATIERIRQQASLI